jgi:uncharacterized protein (TIGR02118 family)
LSEARHTRDATPGSSYTWTGALSARRSAGAIREDKVLKVVFFIRKRADLSREAFRRHYETSHVKLSRDHLPLMRKHVRNYVVNTPGQAEPDFDCMSECWFDDWDALKRTADLINTEKRALFEEDEAKFMDRSFRRSFVVDEAVSDFDRERAAWAD